MDTSSMLQMASVALNAILLIAWAKARALANKHKESLSKIIVASLDGSVSEDEFEGIVFSLRRELYG